MVFVLLLYLTGLVSMFVSSAIGYVKSSKAGEPVFGIKVAMILSPIWFMVVCHLIVDKLMDYFVDRELDKEELK